MRITAVDSAARQQLQDDMLALIASRSAPADGSRHKQVPAAPQAVAPGPEPAAPVQTEHAVRQINEAMRVLSTSLRFQLDEESGRTIVKVVDGDSGEVLRQIPSETTLQIARTLDQLTGRLVSQKI